MSEDSNITPLQLKSIAKEILRVIDGKRNGMYMISHILEDNQTGELAHSFCTGGTNLTPQMYIGTFAQILRALDDNDFKMVGALYAQETKKRGILGELNKGAEDENKILH